MCSPFEVNRLCISLLSFILPCKFVEHHLFWALISVFRELWWTPLPCAVVWKAFLIREHVQMRSSPRISSFTLGSWFCASCCPLPIKSFPVYFTQLYSCAQCEAKTDSLKTGANSCGYSYSFSFFFSFHLLLFLHSSFLPSSPFSFFLFFLSFHPSFFCH